MYTNGQKSRAAMLNLSTNCSWRDHIVCLTEPFLGPKLSASFHSPWNVIHMGPGARACIIAPPWCNPFLLSNHSTLDAVFCRISLDDSDIILGTIYSPQPDLDVDGLVTTLNQLKQMSQNILIFCDTNAHSVLWGYPTSNRKAKQWESVLSQTALEVFTKDYYPTFRNSRNHTSCVDIAFGSANLSHVITPRNNDHFPTLSDHSVWSVSLQNSKPCIDPPQFKFRSADWTRVNLLLTNYINLIPVPQFPNTDVLDQLSTGVDAALRRAMDEGIKKTYAKPNHRWWTPELSQIQAALQNASNQEEYHTLQTLLKDKVIEAKSKDWKNFAASCSSTSDVFLKNKLLNLDRPIRFFHPIKARSGSVLCSTSECIQEMLETWFVMDPTRISQELRDLETDLGNKYPIHPLESFAPISEQEILQVISSLKAFSAPGLDQIPPIVFQSCSAALVPMLTIMFNLSLEYGYIPKAWKHGQVVLIPKSRKHDGSASDYRPITLLPVISKILDKIILSRLQEISLENNWFCKQQYAFIPGRSANQALLQYSTLASNALKTRRPTIALHLDIKGAFDSVWAPLLIKRLDDLNCPPLLINWIQNYLTDRTQSFNSSSLSVSVQVSKSTPQGGSLSPFLWNLLIDPLLRILNNISLTTLGFADDIVCFVSGDSWDSVERRANHLLTTASNWAMKHLLEFNTKKSEFIIYSGKRVTPTLAIIMNGDFLKRVNKTKYLGITFTEKLSWKAHILQKASKAIIQLHSLSAIVNRQWGLSGKHIRTLYMGAIEPAITFGCIAWASATRKKSWMKPLIRVQRLAAQMITSCNSKVHILDLLSMAGIVPIELRIQEIAHRSWISINAEPDSPCNLAMLKEDLTSNILTYPSSIQQCKLWDKQCNLVPSMIAKEFPALEIKLSKVTPPDLFQSSSQGNCSSSFSSPAFEIYTDGSKSVNGTAAALVLIINNYLISSWTSSLHEKYTVFDAELLAIEAALTLAKTLPHVPIHIFSDSLSAVQALRHPSRNPIIENVRRQLIGVNRTKPVLLSWTKAHIGTMGNELADQLAKSASTFYPRCPEPVPSKKACYSLIKEKIMGNWQDMWKTRATRWIANWIPTVKKKMILEFLSNHDMYTIHSFISESAPFKKKLHQWKKTDNPLCSCGLDLPETSKHFLLTCPKQALLRYDIRMILQEELGSCDLSARNMIKSQSCLETLANAIAAHLQQPRID